MNIKNGYFGEITFQEIEFSNSGVTPLQDAARNESGSYFEMAKRLWQNKVGNSAEFPKNPKIQKEWDLKMCQSTF